MTETLEDIKTALADGQRGEFVLDKLLNYLIAQEQAQPEGKGQIDVDCVALLIVSLRTPLERIATAIEAHTKPAQDPE